jgi:hypothetical protein
MHLQVGVVTSSLEGPGQKGAQPRHASITLFASFQESLSVISLSLMSNGLSLIVVAIAGEGLDVNKDKSDEAGTTKWKTEEMMELEEPIMLEAQPTEPGWLPWA